MEKNSIEPHKILIVGEAASIHTAKFVNAVKSLGHDVRLFSNALNSHQDEHLHDTVIYVPFMTSAAKNNNNLIVPAIIPLSVSSPIYRPLLAKIMRLTFRESSLEKRLLKVVEKWKPDVVISLKMQNDGYVTSRAKTRSTNGMFPPWLHFTWGTDIEFFGKDKEYAPVHLPQIKKLLSLCDYHVADTYRDIESAKRLGFTGKSFGKMIAQGGFDLNDFEKKRSLGFDDRKVILVKGRQGGHIGQGMRILDCLHDIKDHIKDFEIKIILATPDVKEKARYFSEQDGIHYECLSNLPYEDLLELFARARITVSSTDVDGSPVFLMESMLLGALPVHSDMESIREWIDHKSNGLLFEVDDLDRLKSNIIEGLNNKALFEQAKTKNWVLAQNHMDEEKIRQSTQHMIDVMIGKEKDKK